MKRLIVLLSLSTCFTFGFTNCNKKCASANPICEETVPNEACMLTLTDGFTMPTKTNANLFHTAVVLPKDSKLLMIVKHANAINPQLEVLFFLRIFSSSRQ